MSVCYEGKIPIFIYKKNKNIKSVKSIILANFYGTSAKLNVLWVSKRHLSFALLLTVESWTSLLRKISWTEQRWRFVQHGEAHSHLYCPTKHDWSCSTRVAPSQWHPRYCCPQSRKSTGRESGVTAWPVPYICHNNTVKFN